MPSNARFIRLNVDKSKPDTFKVGLKNTKLDWLKVDGSNIEDGSIPLQKIGADFNKNLIDFSSVTHGAYITNTGAVISYPGFSYTDYIDVKPGQKLEGTFGNMTEVLKTNNYGNIGAVYGLDKSFKGSITDTANKGIKSSIIIDTKVAEITIPAGVYKIRLNLVKDYYLFHYLRSRTGTFDNLRLERKNIPDGLITHEMINNDAIKDKNIKTFVNKPFIFQSKTAEWIGDSIIQGYINGGTISPENLVKLFSQRVGLISTNRGQGGALFTAGYNEVETILATITRVKPARDFLFIGAATTILV